MRSLETLLSNPSIPALCVYWHADRIEKSHSVLNALASNLPSCPSVRLVVVSTNQFPQLKFKYSAKQLSIQCYWKGELELTGSDEKDMMEFERRVEKRERMVLMGLEEESEEYEESEEDDDIFDEGGEEEKEPNFIFYSCLLRNRVLCIQTGLVMWIGSTSQSLVEE